MASNPSDGRPPRSNSFSGEGKPIPGAEAPGGEATGDGAPNRFTLSAFGVTDTSKSSVPQGQGEHHVKKSKPWGRRKSLAANTKIRVKLPTIESYDKEVVCTPNAAPKVMVRLERVTGTDRVRIKNFKYLSMLSKRITEEEDKLTERTHKRRKDEELKRYRDLVIKGEIEPHEGMEDLTHHPLYRVNRIMKRLNAMLFSPHDSLYPVLIPPKITPTEPFSVYEKTGILFGDHKDHYLKNKRGKEYPLQPVRSVSAVSSTASAVPMPYSEEEEEGIEVTQEEEWGGEDYMEEELERPQTSITLTPDSAIDLGNLLRRSSMSMARRYLGLDPGSESKFKPQRIRIIEEFLNSDEPAGQVMYDFASGISGAMQRTQVKGDEFCSKTHRKLFV